jgi:hypothetical protein
MTETFKSVHSFKVIVRSNLALTHADNNAEDTDLDSKVDDVFRHLSAIPISLLLTVARFFSVILTKTGENLPITNKYTKWP